MSNKRRKRYYKRLSLGAKIAIGVATVLIIACASTTIYVAAQLSKINTADVQKENIVINSLQEETGEGYTNFALFGVDSREGDLGQGTRTDCIIVASLNNKTKEIKLVSVYRDSLLDLSEGTLQKCNAAYSYGGPEQAISMLNKNLDLDITDYATVDFAAISDVIDLLGGVDIEIKEEEIQYVNQYIDETGEVASKEAHHIQNAGMQTLDGVQATTYARIRSTAGGDYTRTERQRYVIEKMVDKILQTNLATINKIINEVFPKVSTSLSATEILSYAKSYSKYKLGENIGFPIDKTTDTLPERGSVVIPVTLETNVIKLHEFLYEDTGYIPSQTVNQISHSIVNIVGDRTADGDEVPKVGEYAD